MTLADQFVPARHSHPESATDVYVLDRDKQMQFIERLSFVESTEGGWVRHFIDKETGQKWVLFHAHAEAQGGGLCILRTDPPPSSLAEWLVDSFFSRRRDDVRGIALEFSSRPEDWEEVIEWLEANQERLDKDEIAECLRTLGILHPVNRRDVIGKPYSEVSRDYRHYQDLAERAARLTGYA